MFVYIFANATALSYILAEYCFKVPNIDVTSPWLTGIGGGGVGWGNNWGGSEMDPEVLYGDII